MNTDNLQLLTPDWMAPAGIAGLCTLRNGGISRGNWGGRHDQLGGLNLGLHCGDDPQAVLANRALLRECLPADPQWLNQVHGVAVHDADLDTSDELASLPRADAAISTTPGVVLAVLTADCLPVLLTNRSGSAVGVVHAGWRGLAGGIVEATIEKLKGRTDDHQWCAWLGPAIGPDNFEVGDDVYRAFTELDPDAARAFRAAAVAGKWFADLYLLARQRLARACVNEISGGGLCTVADPERFYSYRRDRATGRMASLVWIR